MKQSGVEILFQSYLFHRAHRKITIIDETVAFIGGVNIHNLAGRWNDLVVRSEGFLVKNIIKSFIKSY
jgi:phosphatidylserine/phosphatidylglycerophosphate/cardiolipin synthase-like enzyme